MAVASTHRNITDSLTERQRALVRQNLGLVAVHVRRYVGPPDSLSSSRDWQELFQEGCLGLIAAARTYRRSMATPFAAFALARIRRAVARALQVEARGHRVAGLLGGKTLSTTSPPPLEENFAIGREQRGSKDGTDDRHDLWQVRSGREAPETVGDRLRAKIERAALHVGDALAARPLARDNHKQIVRALLEQRHLIPSEECKRPLRQIARDAGCSIMRVARCDGEVRAALAGLLSSDPEFGMLRRLGRTHPLGFAAPIDRVIERELARSAAIEFASRVRRSARRRRAAAVGDLLLEADIDLDTWTPRIFQKLPPAARERLLLECMGSVPGLRSGRRRRERARRRSRPSTREHQTSIADRDSAGPG